MGADVRVVASYDGRWPSRLEETAYLVIIRILSQATGPISVEIGGSPEELVVTARLDQAVTLELGLDLDRVVVIGGQFQVADGTATLRLPVTSPLPVA
jgi:hypothetical protein